MYYKNWILFLSSYHSQREKRKICITLYKSILYMQRGNGTVVPVCPVKACRASVSIGPLFLNLSTKWR
jgi:hypothetical protein